jgi:hypothetical protein
VVPHGDHTDYLHDGHLHHHHGDHCDDHGAVPVLAGDEVLRSSPRRPDGR